MISGTELKRRRSKVNYGATYEYIIKFPKGYLNRAQRRATKHKVHRSKWISNLYHQ